MAQKNHKIGIEVGYSVDKSGLQEVLGTLQTVISLSKKQLNTKDLTDEMRKAAELTKQTAQEMQGILNASWNPKLNQLDLSKVNKEIKNTYGSMKELQDRFAGMGTIGAQGYSAIAREILNTNLQLKQANKLLDEMAVSMGNTIKWGFTSSIFNTFTNSIQKAWDFSKGLDSSLNDIRIVTGKSADEMARFAKTANTAATRLGASTRDFTDAALIYYQQGLSDSEAQARAEITLKAANVTGQSADEVSEQLTAVWNGYKVTAEEAELYIDKLAAVAASTAADLEELSTGMSKVASAANLMGVDIDQLNAQLATIVSVTRQAPESVGTALKTIYARMGDIEAGLDTETTLGSYTEQMKEIAGIDVMDANGQLRDMGEVIEEIGGKWHLYSREQQIALSQAMAGTRQYNNLLALFDNWGDYTSALKESQEAAGTLDKQNEIYLDRIETKLQQLSTSAERTYDTLFDEEALSSFLDIAIDGMGTLNRMVESLGGGLTSIQGLMGGITMLFKKQLSGAIEQKIENLERRRNNLAGEELKQDIIRNNAAEGRANMSDNATNLQTAYTAKILGVKDALTNDEATALIEQQKELGIIQDKIDKLNEYKNIFNEVKTEENDLFRKVNDADNVTQDHFAEAIEKVKKNQDAIKAENDKLDGMLKELQGSQIKVDGSVATRGEEILNKKGNKVAKGQSNEANKIRKQQKDTLKELEKLQGKFNQKSEEYLKLQKKIQKIQNGTLLTSEDIEDINKAQNKALEEQVKLQKKLEAGAQGIAEAESGARENLELELQARQDIIDQQIIQKERQLAISNAVSAMGAITTFSSSLTGFAESWGRAAEGAESWGAVIQKAIIPITTLFAAMAKAKAAYAAYNAMQDATLLKETLQIASKERLNGATIKETIAAARANLVKKGHKKLTEEDTAAILIQEGVLKKKQLTNTGVTVSEETMQKVQKKGTATTLANAAAWWAHPIIAIVAVAALAAAAAIGAVSKGMEANTEAIKESNKEKIEEEKRTQAEIKNNLELYNNYVNLYDQYKEGKVAKEDMAKSAETLIETLGREGVVVKSLKGDYEGLNEEILKARQQEADKLVESTETELNAAKSNLGLGAGKDQSADFFIGDWVGLGDVKEKGDQYIIKWDFGFGDGDEEKIQQALYEKDMVRWSEDGSSYYVNQGAFDATEEGILDYYYKMKDIKENYKKYGMTADEWEESEIAQHIEQLLKDWEPDITAYEEARDKNKDALAQQKGYAKDFNNVDNFSDFDAKYDSYVKDLKALGIEDAEKYAQDFIANYSEEAKTALNSRFAREDFAENLGMSLDELNEAAEGLSNEDMTLLLGEADKIDHEDDLHNYIAKIKAQSRDNQITTELGYTDSAIDSLMEGKELTEEQIKDLQKLEEEYDELGKIQDRNSREYLQKLHEIKQALEDEAIAGKQAVANAFIADAQQAITEQTLTGIEMDDTELDEFKETLKEICEADYEVLVKIESDIQSDFDDVVGVMSNIDSMASKIGDDFIVAAEDLEELNDTFPGILENATILADGTMQLDKDIVASKMAAAQQEVQADTDKTVEKLQNQQAELLAKRDAAQQIADLAGQMVEGEALTAEQEGILNNALNTLKTDNAETTATYEKDSQKDVADTSKINSEAMAQNFSGAYKKMAEDSEKWAKAAKQNMLVATTGKGETTSGDINTAYSATGSSGTVATAEKGELKSGSDINEGTNWKDVQKYYSDLASNYNNAANNVQGKIAEILARNAKFNASTTGVGTGKGSDGKKDGGKDKDAIEAEKDIYHDINVELEQIANNLDIVESQTDKLTGQNLINNLAEQYKLLNQQIDATAEKLAIAHGEQASLQAQLGALGVKFNKDGTIANYSAIFDKLLSNAQKNPNNEKAQEKFKVFEELVGKYDDLITGTIPELVKSMQDDLDKQVELQLQAFHHEIELKIGISEAKKDWNDFKKEILDGIDEDDILGGALASLKDYKDFLNTSLLETNTQHIADIISQLEDIKKNGEGSIYKDNEAQTLEDLQTYYEQMMEDLTYLHEKEEEIHQSYLDMLDQTQEKFDNQIEALETLSSIIEHDKAVIEMIYGQEAYGMMSKFFDKQESVNLQKLDFLNKEVAFWKAERDAAEEGSEEWEKANENMLAAIDSLNSTVEESIQNLQDKYLNTINLIFQNLNNKVTNNMGLDYTETEWDLINKNADQYLDTVNAIYKTQELQNKYLDAIEKSSNPAHQKKLNDLMQQETDYLREQDKLSQYDLDRANLKYELALKQIALEEAQQNKSKLRLRRDSQGNYTYQYTADDDQVSSVQQEISDLYNQLYNLDAEKYRGNLEEIYDIWAEFQEQMTAAAQINDPEKRAAKELLIKEQYGELINGLVEQNENIQANLYQSTMSQLFELYEQDTANYESMTAEQKAILDQFITEEIELNGAAFDNMFKLYNSNISQFENMTAAQKDILMNSMVPQWNSGVQSMVNTIIGENGFQNVCNNAFAELEEATAQFAQDLKEIEQNAGQTFEEIAEGGNSAYEAVQDLVEENAALIESCTTEVEAIKGVITELDNLIAKYEAVVAAAKDAATKGYDYWIKKNEEDSKVEPPEEGAGENEPDPQNEEEPETEEPDPVDNKPSLTKGSSVKLKAGTKWYSNSYGGGGYGSTSKQKSVTITLVNENGSHPYHVNKLGWVRKKDIVGYASGGYTGDWAGTDGRLAMLHKKELILNAHDTDNMLNAITILRDITANLGATLLNRMASISAGGVGALGDAAGLEQMVTINAEFPNVTNSHEIEDAINNLVNRASQHISK